jgi:nicotinamidase-related amidase
MARVLCVIDYQTDFVTGALGSSDADSIAPALAQRIREYLSRGDAVCFTRDVHDPSHYGDSCEGRHIPPHCVKGTPGCELDPRILPLSEGCRVFDKETFASEELADYLRSMNPSEVELAGVATNICVLANAVLVRTALPDASVTVDRRCVASYDRALGEAALDVMSSMCVDVI